MLEQHRGDLLVPAPHPHNTTAPWWPHCSNPEEGEEAPKGTRAIPAAADGGILDDLGSQDAHLLPFESIRNHGPTARGA